LATQFFAGIIPHAGWSPDKAPLKRLLAMTVEAEKPTMVPAAIAND
jgi:hypothetical protein